MKFRILRVRLSWTSAPARDLGQDRQRHRRLPGQQAGQGEAGHHRHRVRAASSGCCRRYSRPPAPACGRPRSPAASSRRSPRRPRCRRRSPAAASTGARGSSKMQHAVEDHAVDDVARRVPVEDLLRQFRRMHVADPQPDRAAGADPDPAQQMQDDAPAPASGPARRPPGRPRGHVFALGRGARRCAACACRSGRRTPAAARPRSARPRPPAAAHGGPWSAAGRT